MIVTLVGRTCSGKTTVEAELVKLGLSRLISTTTRDPRPGEEDGVHYHFVSQARFNQMVRQGELLETNAYGEHFYGKSLAALEQATAGGRTAVAVVEPNGAYAIHEYARTSGVPYLGVWLSVERREQMLRFLDRSRVIGPSAALARMQQMLAVEDEWEQTFTDSRACNLCLDGSGRRSPGELAEMIKRVADSRRT